MSFLCWLRFKRIHNSGLSRDAPIKAPGFESRWKQLFLTNSILSSFFFQPIPNADFIVPVEIDGTVHQVYVLKRPHVDEFLRKMGELYECVLFTASLAKYADPVADLLDQ